MQKRIIFYCIAINALLMLGLRAYGQMVPHSNIQSTFSGTSGSTDDQVSVNPYTGILSVGFPIYHYDNSARGIEDNVSINYDARGIKVDEVASDLGLNWNLSIGGSISRTVKGLPDEEERGYANLPTVPSAALLPFNVAFLTNNIEDSVDAQYDVYHFIAGQESGDFIIGKDGTIITIPVSNTKIERLTGLSDPYNLPDWDGSPSFKITLPNGVQYIYAAFDCATLTYTMQQQKKASLNWFLTKIVSPFDVDAIAFNYEMYDGSYEIPSTFLQYENSTQPPRCGDDAYHNIYVHFAVTSQRIKEIDYPNNLKLKFQYDPVFFRFDNHTSKALKEISLYNGLDFLYAYKFRHSYTDRRNGGTYAPDFDYDALHNDQGFNNDYQDSSHLFSLQLNGIYKVSGNDSLPGYTFNYDAMTLPRRGAQSKIDLLGYFNGNPSNPTRYHYESRFPVLAYARAKSLESISLPTGGKINFTYELHTCASMPTAPPYNTDVYGIPGLRLKKMTRSDGLGQTEVQSKEFKYVDDNNYSTGIMVNFPVNTFPYSEVDAFNPYAYPTAFGNCSGPLPALDPYIFTAQSGAPLNDVVYTKGSPVGYAIVDEFDGTQINFLSRKRYLFNGNNTYTVPSAFIVNELPFPSIPSYDFAWGQPAQVAIYSGNNMLKEISYYSYEFQPISYDNNNFRSLKVGLKKFDNPNTFSLFAYSYYYPITGKLLLKKQKTTKYYPDNMFTEDSTEYSYNSKNLPISISSRNAKNELIEVKLFYPDNYNIPGGINTLITKGLVFNPVSTEVWNSNLNKVLKSAASTVKVIDNGSVKTDSRYALTINEPLSATAWGSFNPSSVLRQPQYYTQVAVMDFYDDKGNLLQYTEKGNKHSTIWGYNKHYCIAQVDNALLSDVAYSSFEESFSNLGGWTIGGQPTFSLNNGITGKTIFILHNNAIFKENLNASQKHELTFWAKNGIPNVTATNALGTVSNITLTSSDEHLTWKLYKAEITGAVKITLDGIGLTVYLDELRLYPKGATMTTFTYSSLYNISSISDQSNKNSYFEFDAFGRKTLDRDMDGNIIKIYEFKNQENQN